jgi:acetolactate synthase-1/2/3 large subunit
MDTVADLIVSALYRCNVKTYFGIPGGTIEPLYNAIARAVDRGQVNCYTSRHETGAAMMAHGFYRESGQVAACVSTSGPGITNMLTGVAAAFYDNVPLIALTPSESIFKHARGALQDSSADGIDPVHLFQKISKYSSLIADASQVNMKLEMALTHALTMPRGPVHLSLSQDLLLSTNLNGLLPGNFDLPLSYYESYLQCDYNQLLTRMEHARRVVVVVGEDAGIAADKLLEYASIVPMSIVSTPVGKRWLRNRHECYGGVVGFSGHAHAHRLLDEADLVIALCCRFDEFSTNAWSLPYAGKTVAIDVDGYNALHYPHIDFHAGTAEGFVNALAQQYGRFPQQKCIELQEWQKVTSFAEPLVDPMALFAAINEALNENHTVWADPGNAFSWATRELHATNPNQYHTEMTYASMAWALPAAIGAAVANPEKLHVVVVGDGALMMGGLELSVIAYNKLPVLVIVLNDSGYGMVRHGQRLGGAEKIAGDLPVVDFAAIAHSMGIRAYQVHSNEALGSIQEVMQVMAPGLIDVYINKDCEPPLAERIKGLAKNTMALKS